MPVTFEFLRSRQWIIARRLVMIGIVVFLAIRQYGGQFTTLLRRPNPVRDIAITRAEFRPELPGAKPAWIIGLRNSSETFAYDEIQLEATYLDEAGNALEVDKLVIRQKLPPGDEKLIGSVDFKSRGAARRGNLKVVGATTVQ
ncbi:MAG: hypothetical protein DMG15_21710 [Acidobacteria bacterium]|nr:MAG: hypothetical protein DMG15_21710 [Acidobacteriota bacterium]